MSKQQDIIDWLREDASRESQDNESIALDFGCNEGTVRRARCMLDAEREVARVSADPQTNDEALELLRQVLSHHEAEIAVEGTIEELKDELKEAKERLKEYRALGRATRGAALAAAREKFPLWERIQGREAASGEPGRAREGQQESGESAPAETLAFSSVG
jgi:hypothetical protein